MAGFDGHIHERQAKVVIVFFAIYSILFLGIYLVAPGKWIWQVSLGMIVGAVGAWAITPDSDHLNMTHEEYRAIKKWGVFGALLVAYMTPYAAIFPHRSMWSHSIVGSLIRIAWVMLVPAGIYCWIVVASPKLDLYWSWGYVSFVIVWCIQDCRHYKQDNLGWLGLRKRRVLTRNGWTQRH